MRYNIVSILKGLYRDKVFCISFQRTGTTSVGKFFKQHKYRVATYQVSLRNQWTQTWFEGKYSKIFKSWDFIRHTVFEDDPWWCLDFYKYLYHKFPTAKFILLTRNPDKWFDSMVSHSNGRTLGNTYIHSHLYGRMGEYKGFLKKNGGIDCYSDNLLDLSENHREHYKQIYSDRNSEVLAFFSRHDKSRIIHLELEDDNKWMKLSKFFNIHPNTNMDFHENRTLKVL